MTPQEFKQKWGVSNGELMTLLGKSSETVNRWFYTGQSHREPDESVLERLTFIDVQWQTWLLQERSYPAYVRALFEIVKNRRIVNGSSDAAESD